MADINLSLAQRQELKMTADLRQAIEMLQLSALEVQELLSREIADNPCLEVESDGGDDGVLAQSGPADTGATAARSEDGAWDDVDWNRAMVAEGADGPAGFLNGAGGAMGEDEEGQGWESRTAQEQSLQDYVGQQYDQLVTEPRLRLVGHFLIDALDDAGYLRINLAEVAIRLRVSDDMVDDARAIIQTLEPSGIGARDLAECLRLQLHAQRLLTPATEVCINHLDKVAARQWAWLAKQAGVKESDIEDAVADVRACNPKPAQGWGSSRIESVIPDVLVRKDAAGNWEAVLNAAAFPRVLAVDPKRYERWAAPDKQAAAYLSERYGKARWLVQALEQRAQNTLKVARAIIAVQRPFLEAGLEFLVPLTMRQAGDAAGVHESTVSRIARGKYMQTPFGVFELSRFFAAGVASSGGQVGVASGSVQAMIARMVKAENPTKPLSDEQLVAMLKQEGVEVARRTVAKYRGVLGIPGTAERRVR